ncbi:MAG: D-alanine--D-alanine ligase [Patescibacteria group bacterium]
MAKIKVAVLMGGKSPEYEISLISGREVVKQLDKNKYDVFPILIAKSGTGTEKVLKLEVDVAFIAMHGPFGEDGVVQGMLELASLKYTGSGVLASAIGMDKIMFRKVLSSQKIPIPKYVVLRKGGPRGIVKKILGAPPYFVKPSNQGSSVGASIVKGEKEMGKALKLAFRFSDTVLVDEYLKGLELTCALLGNENPLALPVIEIHPKKGEFFDYDSKYTESGADEIVPARIGKKITKRIQEIAKEVHNLIGVRGFSRVDFILKDNLTPYVLEINTIPGLTPMSLLPRAAKEAGYSYPALLEAIIKYAL